MSRDMEPLQRIIRHLREGMGVHSNVLADALDVIDERLAALEGRAAPVRVGTPGPFGSDTTANAHHAEAHRMVSEAEDPQP